MKLWDECTLAQKIERWQNVERVLKGLSPHERRKHWDMASWGVKTDCGTVACAAGHCGLDPWFRRRGLRLLPEEGVDGEDNGHGRFAGFNNSLFGESSGSLATKAFFGEEGAQEIFFDPTTRPVSAVIKQVKAHIKSLKAQS